MKRVFLLLFALVFAVLSVPLSVFCILMAVEDGDCGEQLTYTFDMPTGTLTVKGSGYMTDYSQEDPSDWAASKELIKAVIIEDGVLSVGDHAFDECISLESVSLPDSIIYVGTAAFRGCSSLESIALPAELPDVFPETFSMCTSLTEVALNRGLQSIHKEAFADCTSLERIELPDGVLYVDPRAFSGCSSLEEITVNEENEAYTSISGVLFDRELTTVFCYPAGKSGSSYNIPDGITSIGMYAFSECSALKEIRLSSSVSDVDSTAFSGCISLEAVTVDESNGHYASADGVLFNKNMTNLIRFPSCIDITEYSVPKSVTGINEEAFEGCFELTSVELPPSLKNIKYSAFKNCSSLQAITIPQKVTFIGDYAFEGCTALESVNVDPENKNYTSIGGVLFNKNAEKLIQYPLGRADGSYEIPDSVSCIGFFAFRGCDSLESIAVPSSITSIQEYAFDNCSSLNTVLYAGSKEDWRSIEIEEGNEILQQAELICAVSSVVYGDADENGRVTITDVLFIRKCIAGIIDDESGMNFEAADVDGNGRISITDVLLVRKLIAGIITEFPVQQK